MSFFNWCLFKLIKTFCVFIKDIPFIRKIAGKSDYKRIGYDLSGYKGMYPDIQELIPLKGTCQDIKGFITINICIYKYICFSFVIKEFSKSKA